MIDLAAEFEKTAALHEGLQPERKNDRRTVREFYRRALPQILEVEAHVWGIDPYAWDAYIELTPIERALWCDIRYHGLVMYPQFPVGPFFVDFGNPKVRVAVECDGAAWHSTPEQLAHDREREARIRSMGWRVFRIGGRDCFRNDEEKEDIDTGCVSFEQSPGSLLMQRIVEATGIGRHHW